MPKIIEVPDGNRIEFPDDMPLPDIDHVIRTQYYGQRGEIAQQEIATERNAPTVMERIRDTAQSGLRAVGMFPDKDQIQQTRAARATIDRLAAERGETTQQFREKTLESSAVSNPPAFAAKGALNMATGGMTDKIFGDVMPPADTKTDKIAEALGSVVGFTAPLGLAMKGISKVPVLNRILATTEGATTAAKIINTAKNMGRMSLGMAVASDLAELGEIMDSPNYETAKGKAVEAAKSGAEMGAVFGAASAIPGTYTGFSEFFADPFNKKKLAASAVATGLGNAALDWTTGNRISDDRPTDKKVFDYALNTYFLFFNHSGQVKKDVVQKLLTSGKTPQEYSTEVSINGRPARKMPETGPNVITWPERPQLPAAHAEAKGGQRLLTEGVPTGEEPFIQTPEGMRRATPLEASNMRMEAQRRRELGITPDVEEAMRRRGTTELPPERELYQFRPAKNEVAGERWAIVPLTEERFRKFVRPTLPPSHAATLAEYWVKYPDAEYIRLSQKATPTHDLPPQVAGIGTLESLRPGKEAVGHVLKVGSFNSQMVRDFRRYRTPESHQEATGYVQEGVNLKPRPKTAEGQLEVVPADATFPATPDVASGENVPRGTPELWQYRPNKEGAQTEGNMVEIRLLDNEAFRKEIKPQLRTGEGEAESLAEYQSRYPNQTHIAYIRKAGMNIPIVQTGPLAELRPNQEAIKRDWAIKIDSADDPLGKDYRTASDSENNARTLALMGREIEPFAKKTSAGPTIASIIKKTGVDSGDALAQDARETLERAGLNPNLVRKGGRTLDGILESINEIVPGGQRISTPAELLDRIENQPDVPLEDAPTYPAWANKVSAREMKTLIDKAQNGHGMTERQANIFENAFNRALLEQRAEVENMRIAEKQAASERRIQELRKEEEGDASFDFGANKAEAKPTGIKPSPIKPEVAHEPKPRQQEILGSEGQSGTGAQRGFFDTPLSADAGKSAQVRAELERKAEVNTEKGERLYSNPLEPAFKEIKESYGKYLAAALYANDKDDEGNWYWNPYKFIAAAAVFKLAVAKYNRLGGKSPLGVLDKFRGDSYNKLMEKVPMLRYIHPRGGGDPAVWDLKEETRHMEDVDRRRVIRYAKELKERYTPDELNQMSDWIEQEGDLSKIPGQIKTEAEKLSGIQAATGDALERLQMLSPETRKRFRTADGRDTYLHRIYDRLADKTDGLTGFVRRRLSLIGAWSIMRGDKVKLDKTAGNKTWEKGDTIHRVHFPEGEGKWKSKYVHQSDLSQFEKTGWIPMKTFTVREDSGKKLLLWRDWSRTERTRMGENRNAADRFAVGAIQQSHDIRLGSMFANIADNPKWASAEPVEGWHLVSNAVVAHDSPIRKYGKLANMWVAPEVDSAIKAVRAPWRTSSSHDVQLVLDAYFGGLKAWKLSKTVGNPTAWFNNGVSNITMAILDGRNPAVVLARGGNALLDKNHPYYSEIRERLVDDFVPIHEDGIRDVLSSLDQQSIAAKLKAGDVQGALMKSIRALSRGYNNGDLIFKAGTYVEAREAGVSPEKAAAEAQEFYFDYGDIPVGVQLVRDFHLPFASYSYKFTLAFLDSLTNAPWRALGVMAAVNAFVTGTYAYLYGPDAEKKREAEYGLLPEYMKGRTIFGEKSMRLPVNVNDAPTFLDVARIMPGGNVFDMRPSGGAGTGWPDILGGTPFGGNPAITIPYDLTKTGKNFFGEYIYPDRDAEDEAKLTVDNAIAAAKYVVEQVVPNNPLMFGSYSQKKILEALTANGTIPPDVAEKLGLTGVDYAGRVMNPTQAIASTVGVKVRDIDTQRQYAAKMRNLAKEQRRVTDDFKSIARSQKITAANKERAREKMVDRLDDIGKERLEIQRLRGQLD